LSPVLALYGRGAARETAMLWWQSGGNEPEPPRAPGCQNDRDNTEVRMSGFPTGPRRGKTPVAWPRSLALIGNVPASVRLQWALLCDRRISALRRLLYVVSLAIVTMFLFVPDTVGDAVSGLVLPIVGFLMGIPIDAAFDWIVLMLVAVNLLRLFPAPIVSEHYQRIFGRER